MALALRDFSPLEIALLRALIGAVSLGLVYGGLGRWEVFRLDRGAFPRTFILALAGAGIFWPIQTFGVAHSTSTNTAFLVATYP